MPGTRAISTTSRRELPLSIFSLLVEAPKEIHAILKETLSCFLLGRAKDLSTPLYKIVHIHAFLRETSCFLPGRAKDLSAPLYKIVHILLFIAK